MDRRLADASLQNSVMVALAIIPTVKALIRKLVTKNIETCVSSEMLRHSTREPLTPRTAPEHTQRS